MKIKQYAVVAFNATTGTPAVIATMDGAKDATNTKWRHNSVGQHIRIYKLLEEDPKPTTAKVVVELTEREAGELYVVASNGYGDGDYYQGRGTPADHNTYRRAINKLQLARQAQRGGKG